MNFGRTSVVYPQIVTLDERDFSTIAINLNFKLNIRITSEKNIEYECSPVELYCTEKNQYDLIVSSVAFHYVKDFPAIVSKIYSWLKSGRELVFSVAHPICTANPHVRTGGDEKEFKQKWFVDDVIKYHRTVSTYINTLIDTGFSTVVLLLKDKVI